MLPVYVGSAKDLISQKIERLENNDAQKKHPHSQVSSVNGSISLQRDVLLTSF